MTFLKDLKVGDKVFSVYIARSGSKREYEDTVSWVGRKNITLEHAGTVSKDHRNASGLSFYDLFKTDTWHIFNNEDQYNKEIEAHAVRSELFRLLSGVSLSQKLKNLDKESALKMLDILKEAKK